jgi:hypothetical protein
VKADIRRWQPWADAVEKVRGILPTRNNRIIGVDFLNRTCTFDIDFESILPKDPRKIFFRQHRPEANLSVCASSASLFRQPRQPWAKGNVFTGQTVTFYSTGK